MRIGGLLLFCPSPHSLWASAGDDFASTACLPRSCVRTRSRPRRSHRRCDFVDELRWTHGSVLSADVSDKMAEVEKSYFTRYSDLLSEYMASVGVDLMTVRVPAFCGFEGGIETA